MMRGPPIAPPLPRPPPPPPMMLPPTLHGQTSQGASQPIQHMTAAPQVRTQRHSLCSGSPRWENLHHISLCDNIALCLTLTFSAVAVLKNNVSVNLCTFASVIL